MAETHGNKKRPKIFDLIEPIDASSTDSPVRTSNNQQNHPSPPSKTEVPASSPIADVVPSSQAEEGKQQESRVQESIPLCLPQNDLTVGEGSEDWSDPGPSFEATLAISAAAKSSPVEAELQNPLTLIEITSTPAMPPNKRPTKVAALASKSQPPGHAPKSTATQHEQADNYATSKTSNLRALSSKEKIDRARAARAAETVETQLGRKVANNADHTSHEQPAARQKPASSSKATALDNPTEALKQPQKAHDGNSDAQKVTPSTQTKPGQLTTIGASVRKKLPNSIGPARLSNPAKQGRDSVDDEIDQPDVFEVPDSPRGRSIKPKSKAATKGSKAYPAPKPQRKSVGAKKPVTDDDDDDDDGDYYAPAKTMNALTSGIRNLRPRRPLAESADHTLADKISGLQASNAKRSTSTTKSKANAKENALSVQESINDFEDSVTNINDDETTTLVGTITEHVAARPTQSGHHHRPPSTKFMSAKIVPEHVVGNGSSARSKLHLGSQKKPIELSDHEDSDAEQVSSELEGLSREARHAQQTPMHISSSPPIEQYRIARGANETNLVKDYDTHKPIIVHFSQDGPKNQGGVSSKKAVSSARSAWTLATTEESASAVSRGQRGSGPQRISGAADALEAIRSSKGKPSIRQNQLDQNDYSIIVEPPGPELRAATFKKPDLPEISSAPKSATTGLKRTGDVIVEIPSKRVKIIPVEEQEQDVAEPVADLDLRGSTIPIETLSKGAETDMYDHTTLEVSAVHTTTARANKQPEQAIFEASATRHSNISERYYTKNVEAKRLDIARQDTQANITVFNKQGQANPTKPDRRTPIQELRGTAESWPKITGRQNLNNSTPTISAGLSKPSAAHGRETVVIPKPVQSPRETPILGKTRPGGVGRNKLDLHASTSRASVTHEGATRIASVPTVDINGSPVPSGYNISGGVTVLETFSQQQQEDEDFDGEARTPGGNFDFFARISEQEEDERMRREGLFSSNTKVRPASPEAESKDITIFTAQNVISRVTPIQSPAKSLRTDPFINDEYQKDNKIRHDTEATFMGQLRQGLKENEEACASEGEIYDEDKDEDPDKTLVNEEDGEDFAGAYEVEVSSSRSSQSSVRGGKLTDIAMEPDDPLLKWRDALKSHQVSLFDQLVQVAHELVSHLVDKETAIADIVNDYSASGLNLIEQMESKQSADIDEYLEAASKNSKTFARGFKQVKNTLKKDLEDVKRSSGKYSEESRVNPKKEHEKLEEMIEQCG